MKFVFILNAVGTIDIVAPLVQTLVGTVAARGEIGPEGCEISSLVEHVGLSPCLYL